MSSGAAERSRPAVAVQLPPELADLGKSVKLRGRAATSQQQQPQQQGRNCARCGSAFGRFYNTGAACPRCRLRVCRQCRESPNTAGDWLCSVCHRIQDLRCSVTSGESRRGTRREHYLTALDILKYSIRRAWTINGPPGRWTVSRKSTEFRLYRSLPARRRSPLIINELNTTNVKKPITHESFIKPPRVVTTPGKSTPQKPSHEQHQQQPKKSSIPVFRNRSSREFEDIRGPHETAKRSLIPQRYRGSTDDLRRSREDISIPSFIPKLLSPRNKEDTARANSQQNPQEASLPPTGRTTTRHNSPRRDTRDETAASAQSELKMLDETTSIQQRQRKQEKKDVQSNMPVVATLEESENCCPKPEPNREMSRDGQEDSKQELADPITFAKKIDEPPDVEVRKKLNKEELSNDETDEALNRPSSSHLSPEASPLSTRSSKYSPRESESEPTPALPRKMTGESSSASQRIRDAITRTRRESNSSAKYESSGSEGVRLGDSGLSSYVDIARRVKLYGSCGSLGPSTGSCDEVPQRDSATSAGEDEHEDHSRGNQSSHSRMMLRRRRQFDTQGSRRRGNRSHLARSCCAGPEELPAALQQVVAEESSLLDYRRLVFISSDSSSGREEDDADSSCSGSSYLNNNVVANQQQTSGIEDCDWDYFESNSLKLPQIRAGPHHTSQDWSCCPARPSSAHGSLSSAGCCQTCGGSRNAKVLPVPVPIPVPVPYPVPVPASLWTGNDSLSPLPLSFRGAAVCDPGAAAAAAAASWFSWNPRFDPSSLLLSQVQPHLFSKELSADLSDPLRRSQESEQIQQEQNQCQTDPKELLESTNLSTEDEQKHKAEAVEEKPVVEKQEVQQGVSVAGEDNPKQEQRMFRHSQEQDSRSSSGRSSADSSDLEDSASHRFSRVLVVNDDSLTSDNDIEDNEDSDSAREGQPIILRRVSVLAEQDQQKEAEELVVLQRIRQIDEDDKLEGEEEKSSEDSSELEDEQPQQKSKNRYCVSGDHQEIASYNEIYLASSQDNEDNIVLLKSIRPIDPENIAGQSNASASRNFSTAGDYRAFPKHQLQQQQQQDPEDESKSLSERDDSSNDSAVMPDSLEVSMQDLEDSIECRDVEGALLAAPSISVEGTSSLQGGQPLPPTRLQRGEGESKCSSSPSSSESSSNAGALSSSDELHEYSLTPPRVPTEQQQQGGSSQQISESSAALMAKSRKKWQIPASFDIKGLPSTHFLPPERKKNTSHNPLLSAAADAADELQPDDEENANACPAAASITAAADEALESYEDDNDELLLPPPPLSKSMTTARGAHDESSASRERVRGSESEQVGGSSEDRSWYRAAVERRTPTRKEENNSCPDEEEEEEGDDDEDDDCLRSFPVSRHDWVSPNDSKLNLNHLNNVNNNIHAAGVNNHLQANNNKYRSLVMITQAAYQPVNVITSDTTTLLQPQQHEQSRYFQQFAAADANQETIARKNGGYSLSKRPLPCKRLLPEPEVDSGLSVGSASESDDVQSVKNASKQQQVNSRSPKFCPSREEDLPNISQPVIEEYNYSSVEAKRGGPLILEEGLADDDSWVEEISHDEDEQSATTGTEESSEDEAGNNMGGDREEELRGYHRQAIDFTLHTIVEESCEESESEQAAASWRRHQLVSASAPDLDKYLFFGLGGSDNGELDSLSEGSSILSEGLDSLSRERASTPQNNSAQEKPSDSPSGRLEKYFLADFLGGEQDRRDSDGSVGSDSEGRPSPEAQRRKRLVRARGTGRSHSSSLDNLLALAHGSQQNHSSGSHQSLQDVAMDGQESQSEASSTETDCAEEIGSNGLSLSADGQFDTVKRKKKKLRSNAQSPRVSEDRNKTPEPEDEPLVSRSDEDGVKTPQPELLDEGESLAPDAVEVDAAAVVASANIVLETSSSSRPKQHSRDSGFVGSCDDLLLQQPARQQNNTSEIPPKAMEGNQAASDTPYTKDHHHNYQYQLHMERTERLLINDDRNAEEHVEITQKEEYSAGGNYRFRDRLNKVQDLDVQKPGAGSLSRKDSFNNWSSDEETNLMMSKMRQFFKTMVANSNNNANQQQNQQQQPQQGSLLTAGSATSSTTSSAPSPSPRLSGYASKTRAGYSNPSHRTKPPQLVYFENELTRLMKTVPGIRDEQVREIVEYLSSEDTWSDSYDSSDYTSSDLEGATAGGRRSALQEQISQSCQQIINKFDTTTAQQQQHQTVSSIPEDFRTNKSLVEGREGTLASSASQQETSHHYQQQQQGKDTAFVYQKLVQSFTKMAGHESNVASSDASASTPHSSPPLIAKVMHHIGSRLVALMHEVSESNSSNVGYSHGSSGVGWSRRYPHHRTPSSASTTEDDDSTSDSASAPLQLPRSKSHDPLLLINNSHTNNVGSNSVLTSMPPEAEEREASDYERFSWRGSFESALMAADSRTKLSLLACSGGDVSATAMAAKRRSAGDLLFNPKSFSREQLDRVRSCGSIGGGTVGVGGNIALTGGSIEEKIWSNRRRSSVPDAHNRGESGASAGDEDTEDEEDDDLDYNGHPGDSRATTLPRGMQMATAAAATNSLPRQTGSSVNMHKTHSAYHFLPQQSTGVKSARYRPPGFNRNSSTAAAGLPQGGPKRAFSAPGLQLQSRSRRHQQGLGGHGQAGANASSSANVSTSMSASGSTGDEASSLSEACSTPIIGASSRHMTSSHHASMDLMDDIDRLHSTHLATRASLSSLGARSDSMASVYSGAGEGRWCGSVAVRGEVEFSLQYDYKQLTFEVHVTQCRDLAPVDGKRNRSDPYVKVYLLPDKSKSGKRKTKVKKHTLNPVFDETLKFHTSLNSLESRTLWLTVWHSDMFGRNDFLGEVRMPLENKIFDDPRPQWYPLQERTEPFDDPVAYKGEVIVGLKFVPPDPSRQDRDRSDSTTNKLKKSWSRGALHVLVKEARNLQTRAKNSGTCDPFCKSYLLPDKGRSSKQKTTVVRRSTGSPVWNHTFVYKDVSLQELADRGLELTVWDHDRIASNEFLGGVRFNLGTGKHYGKPVDWMDATGREMSLWQNMLERPNFWVEGAVTLRPNLHNHVKTGAS